MGPSHGLVGRLDERRTVATWLDAVAGGAGRVLVVRGEAGIGKSSLIGHLARRATAGGIAVVHGAGEAGSPVPYQAVADWLRQLVTEPPPQASAADVEVVRERLAATLGNRLDPHAVETSQLALHLAVTAMVRAWLHRGPAVVVIDDGHWLDDASMALIAHLAAVAMRDLGRPGAGVGLVVATRSEDGDGPMARLAHAASTEVLDLGALSARALGGLVERRWGWAVPAATSEQLRDVSAGNPLAVVTVVEAGLQRGALEVVDGELVVDHPAGLLATSIDEGIIGRLDLVSPASRAVIEWAAVLGDRPALSDLAALTGTDGDLEGPIDELIDAGLLEDRGASVQFPHPKVRAAILHHVGPRQRARHHATIGELYTDPDEGHLLAAAHHLELAGTLSDRVRLAEVAERAGDRCAAQFGWTAAARFLHAAVTARRELGHDLDPRLLHRLALAEHFADDPDRCVANAREAGWGYRDAGDRTSWAEAELLATREELAFRPHAEVGTPFPAPDLHRWLAATVGDLPGLRAEALSLLAEAHMAAADHAEGTRLIEEARSLAAEVEDHALLANIEFSCGLQVLGELELDRAEDHLDEAMVHADHAADGTRVFQAGVRRGLARLVAGHPGSVLRDLESLLRSQERWASVAERSLSAAIEAGASAALGDFAAVELRAGESLERYGASSYAYGPLIAFPALIAARAQAGDGPGARLALDEWERERGSALVRWRWLVDVVAGDHDDRERVGQAVRDRPSLKGRAPVRSVFGMWAVGLQAEVAVALQREDLGRDVLGDLRWLDDRGVVLNPSWPFFTPRLRAQIEGLAGDRGSAEAGFVRAERIAARRGLVVEQARIALDRHRLGLVEDSTGAVAAAVDLERLGLGPLVPSDLRRPNAPRGVRIVAFADLVDSTQLNASVGDRRYAELLDQVTGSLRHALQGAQGVEFKHTGDGIAAWFTSAVAAIQWAQQVAIRLRHLTDSHPDEQLQLRFGIAAGEPIDRSGDLFGLAVALAARLCAQAAPGQVLVAEEVRLLATNQGLDFVDAGRLTLKGFPDTVAAWRVADAAR